MAKWQKMEYKKFKIRTKIMPMTWGAHRSAGKALSAQEWLYPSLMWLDGGVAQLHVGMSVLKKTWSKNSSGGCIKRPNTINPKIFSSPKVGQGRSLGKLS